MFLGFDFAKIKIQPKYNQIRIHLKYSMKRLNKLLLNFFKSVTISI